MAIYSTLAAVDLGSNTFHLQVGRVVGDQIYPLDFVREPVRLGAGLDSEKRIDPAYQARALECLQRFGERLRGFDRHTVRAVGTNTLRVAQNAAPFLKKAEEVLGFPIEVVSGREEARLIYAGVSHSLPASSDKRLVIDIGGGSTEFIIGRGLKPLKLDSIYMGCVSYSMRFFPNGKITKYAMKQARLTARAALQAMAAKFSKGNWSEAVGSSGSARALAEILRLNGFSDHGITADGLAKLRSAAVKAGDAATLALDGLRADRVPVLPGGLAVMSAAFDELGIETMTVADGSMRLGILYDLLGRHQHHDMRDVTISQFMQRYHVDSKQARRVAELALTLYKKVAPDNEDESAPQYIAWAAKLHEIGISVSYSGYHKHSAYIAQNADMPGFSNHEQTRLAVLLLAHRRSLKRVSAIGAEIPDWRMILALRIATLIYRNRHDIVLPEIKMQYQRDALHLDIDRAWLAANPLTVTALHEEIGEWKEVGFTLEVAALRELELALDAQAA